MNYFTHAIRECRYLSAARWCEALSGITACQVSGVRGYEQQLFEHWAPVMTSPYLSQPLLPLATALPRMLADIEMQLVQAPPADRAQLCQRAELLRNLLLTEFNNEGDDSAAR